MRGRAKAAWAAKRLRRAPGRRVWAVVAAHALIVSASFGQAATATTASGDVVVPGEPQRVSEARTITIKVAGGDGSREVVFAPNPEGFEGVKAGVGTFRGDDGAWDVAAGFALMRGWRPMVKGPRTTIGAEGSTIILQIERTSPAGGDPGPAVITERGFLLEGKKATIVIHDDGVARAPVSVPGAELSERPWVWTFTYREGDTSRGRFEAPRRLDPGADQRLAAFVQTALAAR